MVTPEESMKVRGELRFGSRPRFHREKWHAKPLGLGKFFLISIECEKLRSPQFESRRDMQDVKSTVPAAYGMDRGEPFRLVHHVGKVASLDDQSLLGERRFKHCPVPRGRSRFQKAAKLREPQRVSEFIVGQLICI